MYSELPSSHSLSHISNFGFSTTLKSGAGRTTEAKLYFLSWDFVSKLSLPPNKAGVPNYRQSSSEKVFAKWVSVSSSLLQIDRKTVVLSSRFLSVFFSDY